MNLYTINQDIIHKLQDKKETSLKNSFENKTIVIVIIYILFNELLQISNFWIFVLSFRFQSAII